MRGEKTAKLPAGPMSFVMPGPMFDRQLSEAVKQVATSKPSKLATAAKNSSRKAYKVKNR